jgi:hypothetical protein
MPDIDAPFDEWLRAKLLDAYGYERENWALDRVRRVMERLARVRAARPPLTAEILWIREVTAFTAPGRYVYLSRRLLERCAGDDPVALVLAHEMAHHHLGHLDTFAGWAAQLPRVGGSELVAAAFRLLERQVHGPEAEAEADLYALRLCLDAGFHGAACLTLFDILEAEALNWGDVDGVFGPEARLDPSVTGLDAVMGRALAWTSERLRGYLPIRERKARLHAELQRRREAPR